MALYHPACFLSEKNYYKDLWDTFLYFNWDWLMAWAQSVRFYMINVQWYSSYMSVQIHTCIHIPQTCSHAVRLFHFYGFIMARTNFKSLHPCFPGFHQFSNFLSNEPDHYFFIQLLNLDHKWSFLSAWNQKYTAGSWGLKTARDWWGRWGWADTLWVFPHGD